MKFKSCTAALFYNLPEGNRDVAQLVAHYVRDVGVVRSSRIISTKRMRLILFQGRAAFSMS